MANTSVRAIWTPDLGSIRSHHLRMQIHVEQDTHYNYARANSDDDVIYEIPSPSSKCLQRAAIPAGQDLGNMVVFLNHASLSTSFEDIYGENLARLRDIKKLLIQTP